MLIPAFHQLGCDILQSALSILVLIGKNKCYFTMGVLVIPNNVVSVGTLFSILRGFKLIFQMVQRWPALKLIFSSSWYKVNVAWPFKNVPYCSSFIVNIIPAILSIIPFWIDRCVWNPGSNFECSRSKHIETEHFLSNPAIAGSRRRT